MQKKNLLLVEDDLNLAFVIKDNLEKYGFNVCHAKDGMSGYEKFLTEPFDLCILDIMLPKKNGYSVANEIRKSDKQVPIVFLTAKSLPEDKIKGLKTGADDYITKPFNFEELLLRIEAILKRVDNTSEGENKRDVFTIGNYIFDYPNLELKSDDSSKTLTKKEAGLLRLLCIHQNNVLSRETALKIIWGDSDYFLGRSMDVFIVKLRKYLSGDPRIKIVNIHSVGFRMTVDLK